MSRMCPLTNDVVLYPECTECEDKEACRRRELDTDEEEELRDEIAVEISENKYMALKKCKEAGMGLCTEQRAILDGVVLDDLSDNIKEKQVSEYMGISNDKALHMLGVARKAYAIAKERGHDEEFCRKMWMVGWCHDVGYEFSRNPEEHPEISVEMLSDLVSKSRRYDVQISKDAESAIYYHGKYPDVYAEDNEAWVILNMADMLVDGKGREVTVSERLDDIKERYGERSDQYLTACDLCYRIGLTADNLAKNIT